MTAPSCELEEFHFTRINLAWHEPRESGQVEMGYAFDYNVGRHKLEKHRYRLAFRVNARSNPPDKVGYELDTELVGFFTFPEDTERKKMELLIRVNGCAILYGILRGQIGMMTGSFPTKKWVMPTFVMRDVVEGIEKEKARLRKASKTATNEAGK